MRISGTDIYISKGDSDSLELFFKNDTINKDFFMYIKGKGWIEGDADTVLKENETVYRISFEIDDSHTANIGTFFYDVVMVEDNEENFQTTIIRNSLFIVEESVESVIKNEPLDSGSNPQGVV